MRHAPFPNRSQALIGRRELGFSLIEAVAVIAITAVIGAVVSVFVRGPVLAYVDTARRAELTDQADTALRRMARDLRLAVPNSVRIDPTGLAVEFLLTRDGGRYRAGCIGAATGDPLIFGDTSAYPCEPIDTKTFEVLGPAVNVRPTDFIAIFNLGIPGADAYALDTMRSVNASTGAVNTLAYSGTAFPFSSPASRFQIVETPVSYICNIGARTLTRYWGYAPTAGQVIPPAGVGLTSALVARDVAACTFTYDAFVVTQRDGLVTMRLQLQRAGDTDAVTLYHEVHVNNVP